MNRISALLASACLGLAAHGAAHAATQWDLPLAWPADNYIVKSVEQYAAQVKEQTQGQVVITTHPAGALGFKGPEMLSAIRDGLVPIGDMLLNQQVGENLALGLESQPYLIKDFEGLQDFSKRYRPLLDEIFAKNNQKILFSIPWPQQQIFTKKPIETIADMRGLRIRSSDKQSTEIFHAAGMVPVQLPWGEVVPSLAAGAIEAVGTSSPSAVDGSFWELLKYAYPIRQTWNTNLVSVNLDAWRSLSAEQQATLERLGKEMEPTFWDTARQVDEAMIAKLTANGMIMGTVSDALREELSTRTVPIREAAIKRMDPKARAIVDAFEKR
ncbi:TRAP transporter solute receptor, unknown substrate 5 [plant metagenome]|uniref:TRAP-type C4-dicarboxylate transport system, periplasmic component n=1 Tax=plant metagenome TaxID=1297885 RepID=A0A484TDN2_9ZZZZ